jgi:hypothetical protein
MVVYRSKYSIYKQLQSEKFSIFIEIYMYY